MSKKFFKVFTAGKYPQGTLTQNDIVEVANSYDPSFYEAPLTINHEENSPAYAAISKVIAKGKDLYVSFTDILNEAFDLNKKFRYPSCEFAEYEINGTKKKYLRAVTLTNFPQVKSLDKIQFNENSLVLFSEGVTLNLNKGINMFSKEIIQLAEKLSINVSDYSVEGDLLQKAVDVVGGLQTQLSESKDKINQLNIKSWQIHRKQYYN